MCLAVRDLDENYFNKWKARHHEAALSLDNRDEKLDAIYNEIENNMTLVGNILFSMLIISFREKFSHK